MKSLKPTPPSSQEAYDIACKAVDMALLSLGRTEERFKRSYRKAVGGAAYKASLRYADRARFDMIDEIGRVKRWLRLALGLEEDEDV